MARVQRRWTVFVMINPQQPITEEPTVLIHIDRSQFRVRAGPLLGSELRHVPNPEVSADRDLFLVGGADRDDRIVADAEMVELVDGMAFITVPRTILAGALPAC
jgi:hypothetical protein